MNPGAQQHRYDSNFDAIDETKVEKRPAQVAATKQPNVLSACAFSSLTHSTFNSGMTVTWGCSCSWSVREKTMEVTPVKAMKAALPQVWTARS